MRRTTNVSCRLSTTLALAMLCLMGCAADGAPAVYGQGVPVAPRPPAFNPVTDSPITTGQPGYIGSPERAPRGTDKRVLPPTREPGIWASDAPKGQPVTPSILGVAIPLPPDADEEPTRFCAAKMDAMARDALRGSPAINANVIPCLAARLFLWCLDGERAVRHDDADAVRRIKGAIVVGNRMFAKECDKIPLVPDVDAPFQIITTYRGQP